MTRNHWLTITGNGPGYTGLMTPQEVLISILQRAGKDQRSLARTLDKNDQWIHRRLHGHTRLTIEDAADIAEALGHRFDWAFVPEGSTVNRTERSPRDLELVDHFLDALDGLDEDRRRMLEDYISFLRSQQERGR